MLYLRINPQPVLRILNKCLIVFLAMQAIEEALIVILQCRPVMAAYVVPRPAHAKCIDLRVLWWCTVSRQKTCVRASCIKEFSTVCIQHVYRLVPLYPTYSCDVEVASSCGKEAGLDCHVIPWFIVSWHSLLLQP